MTGRTRLQVDAERRAAQLWADIARDLSALVRDTGATMAEIARLAGVSETTVSRVLAGERKPQIAVILKVAVARGGDLYFRVTAGAGTPIFDRISARMIEALLGELSDRWRPHPEVSVSTPARGSIDLVLEARAGSPLLLAFEFQSELRRLEQTLRWSAEKAAGLESTRMAREIARVAGAPVEVRRVLVLRSTPATRAGARDFEATLAAAYPADPRVAIAALRGDMPWPGDTLLWMSVHGSQATLMDRVPPGLGAKAGR